MLIYCRFSHHTCTSFKTEHLKEHTCSPAGRVAWLTQRLILINESSTAVKRLSTWQALYIIKFGEQLCGALLLWL